MITYMINIEEKYNEAKKIIENFKKKEITNTNDALYFLYAFGTLYKLYLGKNKEIPEMSLRRGYEDQFLKKNGETAPGKSELNKYGDSDLLGETYLQISEATTFAKDAIIDKNDEIERIELLSEEYRNQKTIFNIIEERRFALRYPIKYANILRENFNLLDPEKTIKIILIEKNKIRPKTREEKMQIAEKTSSKTTYANKVYVEPMEIQNLRLALKDNEYGKILRLNFKTGYNNSNSELFDKSDEKIKKTIKNKIKEFEKEQKPKILNKLKKEYYKYKEQAMFEKVKRVSQKSFQISENIKYGEKAQTKKTDEEKSFVNIEFANILQKLNKLNESNPKFSKGKETFVEKLKRKLHIERSNRNR